MPTQLRSLSFPLHGIRTAALEQAEHASPKLLREAGVPGTLSQAAQLDRRPRKPGRAPSPAHQVILLVAHLGGVPAHAVHRQQQVQEGEGRVQPQQVIPGMRETVLKASTRLPPQPWPSGTSPQSLWGQEERSWQGITHKPCQQPPGAQSGCRSRDSSLTGRAEMQPSRRQGSAARGHPENAP